MPELTKLPLLPDLEVFFDCSSPWTYLAFARLPAVLARQPARVHYKPILVGGVFNAVNPDVYERRANPDPRKAAYSKKDLQDWAALAGIRIGAPPVFPVRAVAAMRLVLAADEEGALLALSNALFEAYWGDLKDISEPAVLAACAKACGLDAEALLARSQAEAVKAKLRANTEELIARGGFGSPTFFIGRTGMYFGNDRLPLVEAGLAKAALALRNGGPA